MFSQNIWQPTLGPYTGDVRQIISNGTGTAIYCVNGDLDNVGTFIRTTNEGSSWSHIYNTYSLRCAEFDQTYIWAGSDNAGILLSTNGGSSFVTRAFGTSTINGLKVLQHDVIVASVGSNSVQKTTNGGLNWYPTFSLSGLNPRCYSVDSTGKLFLGTNGKGVYFSTNSGDNWIQCIDSLRINSICCTNNKIFLGTSGRGIYISTNSGSNWSMITTSFDTVKSIALNSNNELLVATDLGIFISTNTGITWDFINSSVKDINYLTFILNKLYIGTESGIYKSTNNGTSWINIGFNFTASYTLDVNANGDIYATTLGLKHLLWKSSDQGNTWIRIGKSDSGFIPIKHDRLSNIYVGTGNGVILSTNNGSSFSHIGLSGLQINYLGVSPANEVYAIGTTQLFKTSNQGQTWSQLNVPNNYVYLSLAFDSTGNIYLGSQRQTAGTARLMKSTNNGSTWFDALNPIQNDVRSITVSPNGNIYFCASYVFRSTNNGANWTQLTHTNISNSDVTANSINELYWISSNTVLRSIDYGQSFEDYTSGFIANPLHIVLTPSGSLIASSWGRGIHRSNFITSINSNTNIVKEYSLSQNYPNPFNPNSIIKFAIANSSYTKLIVFDVLGKEVQALVNEHLQPGTYEIDFDAGGLPSGVYYYKLETESYTETRKMVLIK